jgi:hypothetical protein
MATKKTQSKKSKSHKARQPKSKIKARAKVRKKGAPRPKRRRQPVRGRPSEGELVGFKQRGLGARSGGQSGDTQGLPSSPAFDSESVEELVEEGQAFEAEVLSGVEGASDPDQSEVRTREVAEDDVPGEYLDKD